MIPNGLYHFRLTVFEVLEGSSIDPDDFANRFAPPGKPMGSGHWEMLPIVCDYMELAKEPELRIIEMLKLVNAI
jgi:hypothetical protein